jgi:hypothetical protein
VTVLSARCSAPHTSDSGACAPPSARCYVDDVAVGLGRASRYDADPAVAAVELTAKEDFHVIRHTPGAPTSARRAPAPRDRHRAAGDAGRARRPVAKRGDSAPRCQNRQRGWGVYGAQRLQPRATGSHGEASDGRSTVVASKRRRRRLADGARRQTNVCSGSSPVLHRGSRLCSETLHHSRVGVRDVRSERWVARGRVEHGDLQAFVDCHRHALQRCDSIA